MYPTKSIINKRGLPLRGDPVSILIKNVQFESKRTNIYIEENIISEIGGRTEADTIIEADGLAAFPGLVNTHTHAAMTLLRGYGDDMPLFDWLQKKIWPVEAKFEKEDNYWGSKLAILEMIRSGTTTFNDMYFNIEETARAADEMGIRAVLAYGFVDLWDEGRREKEIKGSVESIRHITQMKCSRIKPSLGPHAVFTISEEGLQWVHEFARDKELLVHMHLSETEKENTDCMEKYGVRPTELLDRNGLLNKRFIAAHGVWLNEKEIGLLAEKGSSVSHNPVSNAKLAVGGAMPYDLMKDAGLNVTLGTDGTASNNNLDMLEEMKFAAVIQKLIHNQQTLMPASEALQAATENGARALRIDAGILEEGKLADIILVDTRRPEFIPMHNAIANLVYAASGSVVDTTICDGRILMLHGKIDGEEDILMNADKAAADLIERARNVE